MLKNLPFKPEYLLTMGTVLLLMLGYQLAFKKTWEAYRLHRELRSSFVQSADLGYQPAYLERKKQNLDKILRRYELDSMVFRAGAISDIAALAEKHQVRLTGVPARDPLFDTGQYLLQRLDFEGDYFSVLKFLQALQAQENVGVPRSLKFRTVMKDRESDARQLVLEVLMEVKK